jgi:methyl-accepting chemotaxis protein
MQKGIRSIKGRYRFFEPYQKEPFTLSIANLQKNLFVLILQYEVASRVRRDILYKLPEKLDSRIKELFHFLRRGKSEWSHVRSRERNFENQLQEIAAEVEKALTSIKEIEKQPDKTMHRALIINQKVDEIRSSIEEMEVAKVWGKSLENGKDRLKIILTETEKIPLDFYKIHRHIDPNLINITITVYGILNKVEDVSENLFQDVHNWKRHINDYREALKKARIKYDELEKIATLMPISLDITPERGQIKNLFTQLCNLESEWLKLKLENVQSLTLEANKVTQEVTSLLATLKRYDDLYKKFSDLISNLYSRIQALQFGFSSQVGQVKYPFRWDLSQQKIDSLIPVWESIEPVSNSRTPDKVNTDYEKSSELEKQLKILEKIYEAVIKQVKELRECWGGARHVLVDDWMVKPHNLDQKVIIFSVENWDSKLQVSSIKPDALKLIQRAEQSIPPQEDTTILESKLKERLDLARVLLTDIQNFEFRQKTIESRYDEILKIEVDANEKIKTTLPWIRAIVKEIDSWSLSTSMVKDIHGLFNRGDELKIALSQRNIGRVDGKLQNVNAWVKEVNNEVNTFANNLFEEIKQNEIAIKLTLGKLDEIGRIKDEEVSQARQLMAVPVFSFNIVQVSIGLDQTHQKIKSSLAQLNQLSKCRESLAMVADPIMGLANDTRECLRKAYDMLYKAEKEFTRKWPPVANEVIPAYEKQSLENIEEDIIYFRNKNQSLENFYEQYVDIRRRAREAILAIDEKIRIDASNQAHYQYIEGNIKSRLKTRIREQIDLIPGMYLTPEMYQTLELKGMEIVHDIQQDYLNKKIDAYEVQEILEHIFDHYNTKINFQDFSIHTNGGPAFAGAVYNSGSISGRSDNYFNT